MRWTLAVSLDRKVFVAIVDSEGIGQQSVRHVARVVKEAKVRMARDRARKANQANGKLMMARRKAKAKVTNGKHARHLKGIAITVGSGFTWKSIVSQKPEYQKTLQLADLVCAHLETDNMMNGSGTIVAK